VSLLLNEEQRMLRDSAAQFLAARSPISALRALRDTRDARGWDEALWREIAELGWPAAVLPEEHGGLGIGWAGLGAVFEQIGRRLAATPLLSTVVLGAGLIERLGSDAQRTAWLPRIAAGETVLALALDETPRHDPQRIATRARRSASGWQLDGEKWFVLDSHVAERLLVVARIDDAEALAVFLVDRPHPACSSSARSWSTAATRRACASMRWRWRPMRCWVRPRPPPPRWMRCWTARAAASPPRRWA
jgi:alkylation response protein AidB-like acyl-CoA dehydrogenase